MQGVESSWESVGKKRSFPSSANHSAGAKSKTGRDLAVSQKEGAGVLEDREELRGAEAMTDIPHKGDNVSLLAAKNIYKSFKICFYPPLVK